MYDISDAVPVETVSSVAPGSSILVSGPAMTGKEHLLYEMLAASLEEGDGVVAVSTSERGVDVLSDIEGRADSADGHQLAVIDCRSEANREERELDSGAFVYQVSAPSDLTGIGIGITNCFERFHDTGLDAGCLGLASLSTTLTYSDRQTVFKFCHVLSSRLDSAGYLGLFTIDSSAHDDQTLQVIKQAFDGLVEIREVDGHREARVRGLRPNPSDWVRL
jgi:KaiC/GvpD/RAD55 family RecA-like ATPase